MRKRVAKADLTEPLGPLLEEWARAAARRLIAAVRAVYDAMLGAARQRATPLLDKMFFGEAMLFAAKFERRLRQNIHPLPRDVAAGLCAAVEKTFAYGVPGTTRVEKKLSFEVVPPALLDYLMSFKA
jgi:hypothetical protein